MIRVHGSAVAVAGRGVLILGPSGAGKSALALQLLALGAVLVADDQVTLRDAGDAILAEAPEAIRGLIEARGVGLLRAEAAGPVTLALVVDLGRDETARLPPRRIHQVMGQALPLVLGPLHPHLAPAIRQYLLAGRQD